MGRPFYSVILAAPLQQKDIQTVVMRVYLCLCKYYSDVGAILQVQEHWLTATSVV